MAGSLRRTGAWHFGGLFCAVIYLISGFWDMLFCILLVGLGYGIGYNKDKKRALCCRGTGWSPGCPIGGRGRADSQAVKPSCPKRRLAPPSRFGIGRDGSSFFLNAISVGPKNKLSKREDS
ncbi:DUF2273 domain-containing protein [Cohnella algarum]|uniref:DUF2273 domain-containing protein n=1 Tax=Cohnella algarum TaxID=2044859 RepID=UPI003B837E52